MTLDPFDVTHGHATALGFRIGDLVYLPDVSAIPDAALPYLSDLKVWILDSLRRTPHPTHFSMTEALQWIERMAPERAVLTNMHIDIDWARANAETADHITPAFDGMQITLPG